MGFNLDFSGWSDARRAMRDSIIEQGNLSANVISKQYETINKAISGLTGAAAQIYGNYKADQAQADLDAAYDAINAYKRTGLAADQAYDPMQLLSISGGVLEDEERNAERIKYIKQLMRDL